jgi:hypothetical protein
MLTETGLTMANKARMRVSMQGATQPEHSILLKEPPTGSCSAWSVLTKQSFLSACRAPRSSFGRRGKIMDYSKSLMS